MKPQYRFVDSAPPEEAGSEVLVFPDKIPFRSQSLASRTEETEIARRSLIGVMNRRSPEEWFPDIVVVLYRDEQGVLAYFVWPIAEKGVCRRVSDEIYRIINNGFMKSVLTFFYVMTHPVKGVPWLYK